MEDDSGSAPAAAPAAPQISAVLVGATDLDDSCGPFIVYSREWAPARTPIFDHYRDAVSHAAWLARSTPGFAYHVMSTAAVVAVPALGAEARAVRALQQPEGKA